MNEPKRYECTACGFVSNRTKTVKFIGASFAVCFKCKGRLKENSEWLKWLQDSRDRMKQQAIEKANGYIMGHDILTAKERAELNANGLTT